MTKYMSPTALHDYGWTEQGFQWEHPWTPQKKQLALSSLKELGRHDTVRILDYGCGDAVMVQLFDTEGYQVEGLDVSEIVINHNKQNFPYKHHNLPDK